MAKNPFVKPAAQIPLPEISEPVVEEIVVEETTEPVLEVAPSDEVVEAPPPEFSLSDEVTVVVPKAFKLNLDHSKCLSFEAGVQQMSRHLAENWWSVANGVEIYNPESGAIKK